MRTNLLLMLIDSKISFVWYILPVLYSLKKAVFGGCTDSGLFV
jgi:hypothetical protein